MAHHHADKKIIAVTGATGAQGSSVVRFLLKDGKYHVRHHAQARLARRPGAQEAGRRGGGGYAG